MPPLLEALDRVAQLPLEHRVADPIRLRERLRVDPAEAFEQPAAEVRAPLLVGERDGGQPVVVAMVPDRCREEGVLAQPELPLLVEQRLEPAGRVLPGRGGGSAQEQGRDKRHANENPFEHRTSSLESKCGG